MVDLQLKLGLNHVGIDVARGLARGGWAITAGDESANVASFPNGTWSIAAGDESATVNNYPRL